jgi:hypothetical protein
MSQLREASLNYTTGLCHAADGRFENDTVKPVMA